MIPQEFFDKYKDWAIETQAKSGVPASISLAQAALESSWGESWLAKNANNFFGIKCSKYWFGECVDRVDNGKPSKFRKYNSVYDSFIDHADFLTNNNIYDNLFNNTNYIDWANGLQSDGYAEDKTYASQLISIIQKYGLDKYDKEGDVQMQTIPNTIIRNRKKLYVIGIIIGILLIILYFVGKKVFK